MVLLTIFDQQICDRQVKDGWPCPHLIDLKLNQPMKHKTQNILDKKKVLHLQIECQHQNLTLCEVSDTYKCISIYLSIFIYIYIICTVFLTKHHPFFFCPFKFYHFFAQSQKCS